jgi:hypothetical protein
MYNELKKTRLTDRTQARLVRDYTPPQDMITSTFADPAMWTTKNIASILSSSYDEYLAEGIYLTKADIQWLSGKRKIDRLLENLPDGKPGLQVFKTCKYFIETFPYLTLNEPGHGDIEDVNSDGDDHEYDALRYSLSSIRSDVDVVRMRQSISRNPIWSMSNV